MAAPARGCVAAAVSTSRATMRPCGPDGVMRPRSMPASLASRRASGVTALPPIRAGPKLRSGVRTSKNGSSGPLGGPCGGSRTRGRRGGRLQRRAALGRRRRWRGSAGWAAAPSPAITATTAPTGATSPTPTRISASVPVVVDGTSIDTLSVSISNRLSPGFTASPADLNHFVTLPSATVSPSCGISTSISNSSLHAFPSTRNSSCRPY